MLVSFLSKKILPVIGAVALAAMIAGCSDTQPPASEPAPSKAAAPPPETGTNGFTAQELKDIAIFENTNGDTHGLTPKQVATAQANMRKEPIFQNRFLGVWTVQNPSDAWTVMEILHEVKSDILVEAGTFHGGSANLWAIIFEHINPNSEVITIDIEDKREPRAKELPIAKERVTFLLGSSTDPKVFAEVHRRAKGKKPIVLLDSLHSKEHVAAEIEAYKSIVGVGSYIILQDTPSGPKAAIDEFLASNDTFVADQNANAIRTQTRFAAT
jgi:cephalosporin hydroxylase